ncbi:transposase [Burkholderia sp. Ac-20384]|nr:transposase [Burkholderia sp. Ac-20384]
MRAAISDPAVVAPGSRWQNNFVGRFNRKLRDELMIRERFRNLTKARDSSNSGDSFTSSVTSKPRIAFNLRLPPANPSWTSTISTPASLPEWEKFRAGHQLLDQFRVEVQAVARLNTQIFLAFACQKVVP